MDDPAWDAQVADFKSRLETMCGDVEYRLAVLGGDPRARELAYKKLHEEDPAARREGRRQLAMVRSNLSPKNNKEGRGTGAEDHDENQQKVENLLFVRGDLRTFRRFYDEQYHIEKDCEDIGRGLKRITKLEREVEILDAVERDQVDRRGFEKLVAAKVGPDGDPYFGDYYSHRGDGVLLREGHLEGLDVRHDYDPRSRSPGGRKAGREEGSDADRKKSRSPHGALRSPHQQRDYDLESLAESVTGGGGGGGEYPRHAGAKYDIWNPAPRPGGRRGHHAKKQHRRPRAEGEAGGDPEIEGGEDDSTDEDLVEDGRGVRDGGRKVGFSRRKDRLKPQPPQPYQVSYLVNAKKIQDYGLTGWKQSSKPDAEILGDENLSSAEKLGRLFGLPGGLDYSGFPKVRVKNVGAPESRAAKAGVAAGDLLLAVNGTRITTLIPMPSSKSPFKDKEAEEDPLLDGDEKVLQRLRQSTSTPSFVFLRKKYESRYVSLRADVAGGDSSGTTALGWRVEGGKVREITVPGGWADARGLAKGDAVVLANETLSEKDTAKVDAMCAAGTATDEKGRKAPLFLLLRRASGDFKERTRRHEVDVHRFIPGLSTEYPAGGTGGNKGGEVEGDAKQKPKAKGENPQKQAAEKASYPPFQVSYLMNVKKIKDYGLRGWAQSTAPDGAVLGDDALSGADKLVKLFGMRLEDISNSAFPRVRIAEIIPRAETGEKTRAAKAELVAGDLLLSVCGKRITGVLGPGSFAEEQGGEDPEDSICRYVAAGLAKGTKCSFLFLRQKYEAHYLQLEVAPAEVRAKSGAGGDALSYPLGMRVQGSKVREVMGFGGEMSWAAERGLQVGDMICAVGDLLSEKDGAKVDALCNGGIITAGGSKSVHLLLRRSSAPFGSDPRRFEVDVARPLLPR